MSDNDKISQFADDLILNKKDIVKKSRGRPPSKINKDGIKKYKKNNLSHNYLSICKNNKSGNLKVIKCSKSTTTNFCKDLSMTKVQINSEKKKRGRPKKITSPTIDIKSPTKFESSILSLITKNDSENEEDLFIDDIECKTETTLEAQNKLLNLLQKPPSFGDYTTNIMDNNIKQHGKKRGRPRKNDIKNCSNNKIPKVVKNVLDDSVTDTSIISTTNKHKDNSLNTKIKEEISTTNYEHSNKDKYNRKNKNFSISKLSTILPLNVLENSILPNSNNLGNLNCSHNINTSTETILPVKSDNIKSKSEKDNSKSSYNESNSFSSSNECNISSHLTEKTLSNLFKCDTIVPQIMEKKKRGRPRGSLASKNRPSDLLFTPNSDNLMEKILGSFSNDISIKKKRGRPYKINLSQVPANNILPTIDNNGQNLPNIDYSKAQKCGNKKIGNLSNTSNSHSLLISKEETKIEERNTDSQKLNCNSVQNIYDNKDDLQNGEENIIGDQKNETTVVVTLSSDGTYTISGNLPKIPKILICNGTIENSNECIKIPIQLIINNQSGNINSNMTPITLSPENLSRSESIPSGSDSNQVNESNIPARNNSFSSNAENHSNINIKKSSSNSCFDDQKNVLYTKLIHNESIISTNQGNNSIPCINKNFISPTSISGLEEEYNNRSEIFKPFMPKSILPINITSLRENSLYNRKGRASSLPPFSSPK
uniref:Origin recognition complex subunit 1 n=1 Tax=Strongyloides stercoralis TaxID=6248 RepID=A0A0K0DWE2_STRER